MNTIGPTCIAVNARFIEEYIQYNKLNERLGLVRQAKCNILTTNERCFHVISSVEYFLPFLEAYQAKSGTENKDCTLYIHFDHKMEMNKSQSPIVPYELVEKLLDSSMCSAKDIDKNARDIESYLNLFDYAHTLPSRSNSNPENINHTKLIQLKEKDKIFDCAPIDFLRFYERQIYNLGFDTKELRKVLLPEREKALKFDPIVIVVRNISVKHQAISYIKKFL